MEKEQEDRTLEEVVQPQETQQPVAQETSPSTEAQEKNWRKLREEKEAAERERDELLKKMRTQEASVKEEPSQEEEDYNLAPDDLVEWRHVEKRIKKLEGKLQSYQQQSQASSAEIRLKSQFADFDKVVTKENIEKLKQQEPELAQSLLSSQDLYSAGVSAYKLLKNFGYAGEDPYAKDRDRVKENAQKPLPSSAASPQHGSSPLEKADLFAQGLTPELKKQLLKEMSDASKRA